MTTYSLTVSGIGYKIQADAMAKQLHRLWPDLTIKVTKNKPPKRRRKLTVTKYKGGRP